MRKSELLKTLEKKGGRGFKSWLNAKIQAEIDKLNHVITWDVTDETVKPGGNWNTAKDWFPTIEVFQDTRKIKITTYETYGHQKKASVETEMIEVDRSDDGTQIFIRGSVDCRNWQNGKCSGSQSFCFAVFIGDSGHIYTHRTVASKGWMNSPPDIIRKRLRKLGIGAINVLQQGDFLLKPANRNAHPDEFFKHERMGSGHHNFELPQLYELGQFWIQENTTLIHTAIDGIKHPDVIVPPGKYIVGTTSNGLNHSNRRD